MKRAAAARSTHGHRSSTYEIDSVSGFHTAAGSTLSLPPVTSAACSSGAGSGVVFCRPELDRSAVEPLRSLEGAERVSSVARFPEREPCASRELFRGHAGRSIELERGQVVVREHLGVILESAQ